jgi:hypothetical protein
MGSIALAAALTLTSANRSGSNMSAPRTIIMSSSAKRTYFVNEDGDLMPTRKNQPAPDLKFFNRGQK